MLVLSLRSGAPVAMRSRWRMRPSLRLLSASSLSTCRVQGKHQSEGACTVIAHATCSSTPDAESGSLKNLTPAHARSCSWANHDMRCAIMPQQVLARQRVTIGVDQLQHART